MGAVVCGVALLLGLVVVCVIALLVKETTGKDIL